ncbi:hypothetical protein FAJ36_03880 [Streptococcus suis]|uniref:Uncharacterized protein n=1 Tax=Streptococcus suis TaxID=1307 RepID=A0A4T2HH40_STRSU|nr:hypothetical protein FAJ36_03880 [Streptococcus suis]TII11354.1 hypothetical protein FAJ40_00250 [Streptococcus suis]
MEIKRTQFASVVRSDLECDTRTNLPINHCAEMLTQTLKSGLIYLPSIFLLYHFLSNLSEDTIFHLINLVAFLQLLKTSTPHFLRHKNLSQTSSLPSKEL